MKNPDTGRTKTVKLKQYVSFFLSIEENVEGRAGLTRQRSTIPDKDGNAAPAYFIIWCEVRVADPPMKVPGISSNPVLAKQGNTEGILEGATGDTLVHVYALFYLKRTCTQAHSYSLSGVHPSGGNLWG